MHIKRKIKGLSVMLLLAFSISACSKESSGNLKTNSDVNTEKQLEEEQTNNQSSVDTNNKETSNELEQSKVTEETKNSVKTNWDEVYSISEYTPNEDRLFSLDLSSDLDKYELEINADIGNYDTSFKISIEAENAMLAGDVKVESTQKGFSGTGYINGIEDSEDTVTFRFKVPGDGAYDLNFISCGVYGYKENIVLLDGQNIGTFVVEEGKEFADSFLRGIYMEAGSHEIMVSKSWGWVLIDRLVVSAQKSMTTNKGEVSAQLINPYATKRTKQLMQFLVDINGEYILSGQYAEAGLSSAEFDVIEAATGRVPAILGLDLMESSPSRVSHGSKSQLYARAKAFDEVGGVITLCWHWNAPEKYLYNTNAQPWYRGFYTEATNIDLGKIMSGEDEEGYQLLMDDIDVIAFQLKRLQELDIPILFRPLHEASGGWFWWGASGPEAYKKLWKVLYEKLTYEHGVHNLIWVWNGQSGDWYPGDEYCDIIGEDLYPGNKVYSSQSGKYNEAVDYTEKKKIIAMSENGCLFDPDLAFRDHAVWSWFGSWSNEFVIKNGTLSEEYTERYMFDKVYNHAKVITLDELPDLKTYGD